MTRPGSVLSLIAALGALAAPALGAAAPAGETTVFQQVNVLPMTGTGPKVIPRQTVVVRDDRIVSVAPAGRRASPAELPAGAKVVDGTGKYLIPGLGDMHGHIPRAQAEVSDLLFLYVANGVTTVRGMLGHPGQLELREAARRGEIISPTLYLAGPSFNEQSINSPVEAVAKARQQKEEGWDLLEVRPGLTRDEYDAMARTAREEKIRFGGHVPEEVGLLHAIEMGQESFEHLDGFDEYLEADKPRLDARKLAEVVERSRAAEVWVVPTMVLSEVYHPTSDVKTLIAYPELAYTSQQNVDKWTKAYQERVEKLPRARAGNIVTNRIRILEGLSRGGVKILTGTDAPGMFNLPGFSLHRELRWMRRAGMTPHAILVSGTRRVGEYFKASDSFGTIAPGQRADLVLLDGNPLNDIGHAGRIAGVMVRGRWLPREELDTRLAAIRDKHRR